METLTTKQRAFAENYVLSGNAKQAALDAGYSASVAKSATREVLGSSAVQQEVSNIQKALREEVAQRLAALSVKAVNRLEKIIDDEDAPATAAARACDSVLDRAGHLRRAAIDTTEKGDELQRFLDSLQQ